MVLYYSNYTLTYVSSSNLNRNENGDEKPSPTSICVLPTGLEPVTYSFIPL